MEHLTAKPAELALRAMQNSSKPGENVLDLFGGSGSTLIAAQQTGRKCYLMEIDPLYCDVICDRFQRPPPLRVHITGSNTQRFSSFLIPPVHNSNVSTPVASFGMTMRASPFRNSL